MIFHIFPFTTTPQFYISAMVLMPRNAKTFHLFYRWLLPQLFSYTSARHSWKALSPHQATPDSSFVSTSKLLIFTKIRVMQKKSQTILFLWQLIYQRHCKSIDDIVPQRDWSLAINSKGLFPNYPGLSTHKILQIPPHTRIIRAKDC